MTRRRADTWGSILLLAILTVLISACSEEPTHHAALHPVTGQLAGFSYAEQRTSLSALAARLEAQIKASRSAPSGSPRLQSPEAETLHARARLSLLLGDSQLAVEGLSRALEIKPESAALLSDLAAARLELGQAANIPYEFFLATRAAQRALSIDPSLPAARFNFALALSYLPFPPRAAEEWDRYLEQATDVDWANEARYQRAQLGPQPIPAEKLLSVLEASPLDAKLLAQNVALAPRLFREHTEDVLLPAWGSAASAGRWDEAQHGLEIAKRIGGLLIAAGGDPVISETVAQIERLQATSSDQLSTIADGLQSYGVGRRVASRDRYDVALESFERAERLLSEAASPFAGWATYRIALCQYQHFEYSPARDRLQRLLDNIGPLTRPALRGRIASLLGLVQLLEGDPASALKTFESALESFRTLREKKYQSKLMALIAHCFDYLGQPRKAWNRIYSALKVEQVIDEPTDRLVTYSTAAWLAQNNSAPRIALLFQEELLHAARSSKSGMVIADALRVRASILNVLGAHEDAESDLREAKDHLLELGDTKILRGIEGDLALIETESEAANPSQAIAKLGQAIEILRSTSYSYHLALALLRRARLLISLDRFAEAEQDLEDAISESESKRSTLTNPQDRISYFDQMRDLLDTMISLQIHELRKPNRALEFSERAKARVLWDWLATQPHSASLPQALNEGVQPKLKPDTLRRAIPSNTLVIEYALLPDSLIIWTLHAAAEPTWQEVGIGAVPIANLVERFRELLQANENPSTAELTERLYDLLIRPVASQIETAEHLVFIPDGPLHSLPFSLLRDRSTQQRLFQGHSSSVAPNLEVYITSLQRNLTAAHDRDTRALVVTSPQFDRTFHDLSPLTPGELPTTISQLFPQSLALSLDHATGKAFLSEARDFEVAHFGGHAVINTEYPMLSYLIFAPDEVYPSGVIYSGTILEHSFSSTRLVVLASCNSAAGRISRTEGVESLARAFLAAGVPGVIASLWPVDDRSTAEFFPLFYHHLAATGDAARALQLTQIQLFESSDSDPLTWGAFVTIGHADVTSGAPGAQ